MTKKKPNHIAKIGQQLFSDFMSLPKPQRTALLKQVEGETRPIKYLYALAQQPEPLWEYVCGILPYDDAVEMTTMKMVIERSRFCQLIDSIDPETLNEEEGRIWDNVMDEMNNGTFNFDMADVLQAFHVPPHLIDTCFLDYSEVYHEILSNDDEYDIDMYHEILKRLKPEYIQKINQLQKATHLIIGGLFETEDIDLSSLSMPKQTTEQKEDKLLNQLYFIDKILSYLNNQNISTPVTNKCEYYWERMAKALFVQISKQLKQLPAHKDFPEIARQLKQTGTAFSEFFPEVKENDLDLYYNLLLEYTRRSLCLAAHGKTHEEWLMKWFSQQMGISDKTISLTTKQQTEDNKTGHLITAAVLLEKMIHGTKEESQEAVQSNPDLSEQIIQKFKKHHDITTPRLTKEVIQALKQPMTYQSRENIVKKRSLFYFMQEYELLYVMGIFNQDEFNACQQCVARKKQKSTLKSAKLPIKITDIYTDLLNQPENWIALPLKKEYIEAVQQIKLASNLYQQLYTQNLIPVNLLAQYTFLSETEPTDSALRQEGIFLQNMIFISKSLSESNYVNPQLEYLVDSYWQESVSLLTTLEPYQNRSQITQQIQENLICFDAPDTPVQNGFQERRQTHQYLLADIDELICLKYKQPSVRNQALSVFHQYTHLFETRLNTTIDEQINMALNRSLRQNQNIHE